MLNTAYNIEQILSNPPFYLIFENIIWKNKKGSFDMCYSFIAKNGTNQRVNGKLF